MISRNKNIFLSLGSNVGRRIQNLKEAISKLNSHAHISLDTVSRFYETEPLYNRNQEDFLNCAIQISTDLAPRELLDACLEIENEMGRQRERKKNSPRIIDIDIVFFGNQIIHSKQLTIPHCSYGERNFVLVPLCDIAPDFICPDSSRTVKSMLANCKDESRVHRYMRVEMA